MNRLSKWPCWVVLWLLPLAACDNEDPVLTAAKATWKGDTKTLEATLSKGVSPDAIQEGHPLLWIAMNGRGGQYSAEVLLAHGAHVNKSGDNGWTALMEAAYGGDIERTEYLLRHGADPNQEDEQGGTSLFHLNSSNAHGAYALANAHILVVGGADPCHRDNQGKMAEEAVSREPTAARAYLLEACRKRGGQ